MAMTTRIERLEKRLVALDPVTGAAARRCPACRDGARRRQVTRFDGVPAWADDGGPLATACPGCGREIADVVDVRGIDPAAL
ncbi:MAG TPA: hypothetical protein PKE29_16715 [Phycisphaerales bacterium]|nr:hypothetical protein [Phycisphaerales bacterium]